MSESTSLKKEKSKNFMERLSKFIVDKRNLFFLLYSFAIIFCLFSMNWVHVENDVTSYLPEGTETRLGIEAMNANFEMFGTGRIMISNVTFETADSLQQKIAEVEGVDMVTFLNTEEHYKDASALIDVTFDGGSLDESSTKAMTEIREILDGYDFCIDSTVGYDENATLAQEMLVILIVAVVIILIVLTLTSRSYAEVPVLLITFGVAALLNMGTNFIFDKISFFHWLVPPLLMPKFCHNL